MKRVIVNQYAFGEALYRGRLHSWMFNEHGCLFGIVFDRNGRPHKLMESEFRLAGFFEWLLFKDKRL